jgi:hypothetical protein
MAARALTPSSIAALALAALGAALGAAPAFADPGLKAVERMFLERTAIAAADKACNLFTDGERLALQSGLYQSEGELLRANKDPDEIASLAEEVRAHARALGCDHPSVLEVAGTVRASYRQFVKSNFLEYAGKNSTWGASRSKHDAWGVKQTDKESGAIFGLRRASEDKPTEFTLAVAIPWDDNPPSAVKLNMRDAKKMQDPWLGKLFGANIEMQPAARSVSRPEWAGKMEEWEDNVGDWFNVYSFPKSAIDRLDLMDPREAVEFELTPSRKAKDQTPVKIVFEVGDFRAARAFAMIPAPPVSQLAAAAAAAKAAEASKPAGGHH